MKATRSIAAFDSVAEPYDEAMTPLADEYVHLIVQRFGLSSQDTIIDLGCGSGLLTFALSKVCAHTQGLDSSKKMLEIARKRDPQRRIEWIEEPVEQFNFGKERYKLIISFEAFHLFPTQNGLVRNCLLGLVKGGYLSVGWCNYHWESLLRPIIEEVFASHGVHWGEWGYQRFSQFGETVAQSKVKVSNITEEEVTVSATSHISTIAAYLTSIDKAARLKPETRNLLRRELVDKFSDVSDNGWLSGNTVYAISYCRKLGH